MAKSTSQNNAALLRAVLVPETEALLLRYLEMSDGDRQAAAYTARMDASGLDTLIVSEHKAWLQLQDVHIALTGEPL